MNGATKHWCPYPSVLDVELKDTRPLPFVPPVSAYIADALVGLRWGAGDARSGRGGSSRSGSKATVSSSRTDPGAPLTPRARVRALEAILQGSFAQSLCACVFWLAVAVVFQRAEKAPRAVEALRDDLSAAWHRLSLDAARVAQRGDQDLLLAAMPLVFVQAVFRALCDAFEEDRKTLMSQSQALIDKLMFVTQFEVNGFQLRVDAVRRARRMLFLKRVVQQPHVDQREFMKGVRRQEMLEDRKALQGNRALAFPSAPDDAQALDETQLEHVMEGRGESAPAGVRQSVPTLGHLGEHEWVRERPTFAVPVDLIVERYATLEDGARLLEKHMDTLAAVADKEGSDSELEASADAEGSVGCPTDPPSPANAWSEAGAGITAASPRPFGVGACGANAFCMGALSGSPSVSARGAWEARSGATLRREANAASNEGASPLSPHREKRRILGKQVTTYALKYRSNDPGESKDAALKRLRERQEALEKLILEGPLPKELRARELHTCWVSPAVARLTHCQHDRAEALNKPEKEAFRLKMAAPRAQGPSSSTPALSSFLRQLAARDAGDGSSASPAIPGSLAGLGNGCDDSASAAWGASVSKRPTSQPQSGGTLPRVNKGFARSYAKASVVLSADLLEAQLPVAGIGGGGMRAAGASAGPPLVSLMLCPPKSVGSLEVLQRFEGQSKAFQQQTFAEYMREFDILTGNKKLRIDGQKLREEEDACSRKWKVLVGGEPSRMLHTSTSRSRHG